MKKIILSGLVILTLAAMWGCTGLQTRTEIDHYTIAVKDTTTLYDQMNAPGNRDNGIIYPSSRTIKSERYTLLKDSTVEREYPNFIRLGLFESVGLIGSGSKGNSGDYGPFAIFPNIEHFNTKDQGTSNGLFQGAIWRFGISELRLRWFRDAKNWTIGTSALEIIKPDAKIENTLISYFPLNLRKRWYLSEKIPYVSLSAGLGIGWYPSQYVNVSGAIEVGSIGGLNIRGYLGFAAGMNSKSTSQVMWSNNSDQSTSPVFPYAGLGISFLDFHNLVPETLKEWKDHEHSSWNIGIFQMTILGSTASETFISDTALKSSITGFHVRIANAEIAIPVLNNKFFVGTSLANMIALGKNEWGIGILPIRLGYFQTVLADELSTEPFFEFNYYPSQYIHIGNKINLRLTEVLNLGIVLGYASGKTDLKLGSDVSSEFSRVSNFSRPYLGITIGIVDRIFYPEDLRYNK
jgi:hypothetical protein